MTLKFVFMDILVLVFISHEIRMYVRVYTGLHVCTGIYVLPTQVSACVYIYIYTHEGIRADILYVSNQHFRI